MPRLLIIIILLFYSIAPLEAKTVTLSIQGLNKELIENIQSNLSLYPISLSQQDLDPEQFQLFLSRAAKEITQSLEPFGYYAATVQETITPHPDSWHLTLTVEHGPATILRKLSTQLSGQGLDDPALSTVFQTFRPKVGEVLDHDRYETSKTTALTKVIGAGYPLAHFTTHVVHVFPEEQVSDIELTLATGPLYHVGEVQFAPSPFDDSLLNRFVHFDESSRYSAAVVADLQTILASSPYIKQVNVIPKFDPDKTHVPLWVELEPQKPNQYLTGLGYGTDTGIRARAEWERRYFNRFGHGLHALVGASQRQKRSELTYILPGKDPSLDRYEAGFAYLNENLDERLSQITEWSLSNMTDLHSWQRAISVRLHEEAYRENYFVPKTRQASLLPRIVLSKTKRDQLFNPGEGYKLILSVQGIMDRLSDGDNFLQTQLFWKTLIPLRENTSLMVRAELGATFPNNIAQLPLSLRYFAGGDNSIRGFSYKSIKPTFPTEVKGQTIQGEGGRFLSVGSLELVQKIAGPFSASVFLDLGSAYNSFDDPFAVGAGIGIRWNSAVGPIRLELAKPVSYLPGLPKRWRWHVAFGPEI